MKNSADQVGCYPPRPKAQLGNTLRYLRNSSYPMKAEFNNCFYIIYSNYFQIIKGENELFVYLTQPCPQVFSVNKPDFGKQNSRGKVSKFPSVLRVIDRSDRNLPITAR